MERAALPASFSDLLRIPLRQPGKTLAGAERPLWPATVLAACTAAGGDVAIGRKVAAAVEIFMASLDVFDEIEDGDHSPTAEAAGAARALNAATALLLLAQQALLQLPSDHVPAGRVLQMARVLTEAGLTATGGQHRDLATEGDRALSPEGALETARLKAGALAAGACRLGALVGTADPELLGLYHAWGHHYGTAAQLANDLHDAENVERKTDAERQKGTLPLLYARQGGEGAPATGLAAGGALHFTWVILEIERQKCTDILGQLAARGQEITALRHLLGKTE